MDPIAKSLLARSARSRAPRRDSDWLGTRGGRLEHEFLVLDKRQHVGQFGAYYWHRLRDDAGNVAIYEGSLWLGEVGHRVQLRATVSSHTTWQGRVRQTNLSRPKVLRRTKPAPAQAE